MTTDRTEPAGAAAMPRAPADPQYPGGRLRFSDLELDLGSGELWRAGERCPLRPVATRALQLLVENRHRLVSRNDLRRHLWGDAALEWEAGIYQVIRQLRRALGDDPRTRAFIATIPRRGYRWTAPVTAVEPRIGPGRPDAPGRSDAAAGSPSRSAPRPLHHRLPGARRWNRIGLFLAGAASLPLAVLLACLVAGLAR